MIKIGDKITTYLDPFTKQEIEGRGVIRKIESVYRDSEYHVLVEFDDEPGTKYFRVIYT